MSSSEQPEKPGQTRSNRTRSILARLRAGCLWCGRNPALLLLMIAILLAVVLIFRILFAPVEIGAPATESEALVRSNERLIQIVQWTISTVLVIGGGLIGLNWYRDEKRYDRDRQEVDRIREEFDRFQNATARRVWDISQETIEIRSTSLINRMVDSSNVLDVYETLVDGYQRISALEAPFTLRTGVLLNAGLQIMVALDQDLVFSSLAEERAFRRFGSTIVEEFPDLQELVEVLSGRIRQAE
ncbi:MAG: hypothetical protein ACR2OU_16480 [Thermomicrobiales bacterium]